MLIRLSAFEYVGQISTFACFILLVRTVSWADLTPASPHTSLGFKAAPQSSYFLKSVYQFTTATDNDHLGM